MVSSRAFRYPQHAARDSEQSKCTVSRVGRDYPAERAAGGPPERSQRQQVHGPAPAQHGARRRAAQGLQAGPRRRAQDRPCYQYRRNGGAYICVMTSSACLCHTLNCSEHGLQCMPCMAGASCLKRRSGGTFASKSAYQDCSRVCTRSTAALCRRMLYRFNED